MDVFEGRADDPMAPRVCGAVDWRGTRIAHQRFLASDIPYRSEIPLARAWMAVEF